MVVERAIQSAAAKHRDRIRGQKSLFADDDDDGSGEDDNIHWLLPEAPDFTQSQKLAFEKEVFGFYLTSHPLSQYADEFQKYATHTTKQLAFLEDGDEVLLGGMIGSIKRTITKLPAHG